jgi:hypothetical protein
MHACPWLAPVLSACFLLTPALRAAYGTADWARANLARLEGTSVTLQVSSCEPGRVSGDEQEFTLRTYSKDGFGGQIQAIVPVDKAAALFERLGSVSEDRFNRWHREWRVKTKAVSGILRQTSSGVAFLDLRPPPKHTQSAEASGKIRTWTDDQGRTVEAEYLSANAVSVRIRRVSDGRVFTFELAKLSAEDQAWVASQGQ